MKALAEKMPGGAAPGGIPALPKDLPTGLRQGLPNLPGLTGLSNKPTLPGLGGFPGLGKKKGRGARPSLYSSFRDARFRAGPESILPIVVMDSGLAPLRFAPRNDEPIEQTLYPTLSGELNVSRYPPCARRHQETPGLSRGRRRLALSARRALHRTAGAFQSAAAEGQRGAAAARHGKGQGLARQGRAALGPGVALPRCRRRGKTCRTQQSGKGRAAQGA